ncbi:hypothetical protein [Shinella sp.]
MPIAEGQTISQPYIVTRMGQRRPISASRHCWTGPKAI